jgi:hypothetical protein
MRKCMSSVRIPAGGTKDRLISGDLLIKFHEEQIIHF